MNSWKIGKIEPFWDEQYKDLNTQLDILKNELFISNETALRNQQMREDIYNQCIDERRGFLEKIRVMEEKIKSVTQNLQWEISEQKYQRRQKINQP